MQNLIKQEQFEIEILNKLNSKGLLRSLIFGGETMLRLCWGLNRFSVDLDFWVVKRINSDRLFNAVKNCLAEDYFIKDATNKFYTLLFEIKTKVYPRSLKIEIRKEPKKINIEQAIAYSKYSNLQVMVKTVSLKDMMYAKIKAFLEREEIRDAFDIEFLFKKGIPLDCSEEDLKNLLKTIRSLTKRDYAVKLGALLEEKERNYYITNGFKILELAIKEKLFR
ncbi:MAG: nucleotidyl transferase AbiEii/AbiGii toxin family protein [Candidatus Omnitrophica bacterium]|nr:nucleotidyl transferase AbiEii/AbiGii toxin family protein [Candidatus Omnitrophota bacterium]MCM8771216.1 nucleotidyl transferase AbiEii/AbiGii toxin family protein [Candidatus Omnitrophota bacterium]